MIIQNSYIKKVMYKFETARVTEFWRSSFHFTLIVTTLCLCFLL